MLNKELQLKIAKLLMEESLLTPEKEAEYISAITARPFVVGRKNWLFSNTQNGARTSAMIYSLAVTACANGINVEQYFYRLITSDVPVMPWDE